MSEDLSKIKSKITSKSTTKVNPYLNQATFMIEFCLFISYGQLGLVYFCNERLEPIDWHDALKETRVNNCHNTERISNFMRKLIFLQYVPVATL